MKKLARKGMAFVFFISLMTASQSVVQAEQVGGSAGNTASVGFYEGKPTVTKPDVSKPSETAKPSRLLPQTGEEMMTWGAIGLGMILVFVAIRKKGKKDGDSHA